MQKCFINISLEWNDITIWLEFGLIFKTDSCDEKILKIIVRIYTACGGEGSNCASVAIKISDVCLGSHCWLICLVCSLNSCWIYPPPGAKMLSKFKFFWKFCDYFVHEEVNIDILVEDWPCWVGICQNSVTVTWADEIVFMNKYVACP